MTAPRTWPAVRLDLGRPLTDDEREQLLVDTDQAGVISLDEDADGVSLYFQEAAARESLRSVLAGSTWVASARVSAIDVPDDGWAARSQADLAAVRVEGVIIAPPWDRDRVHQQLAALPAADRPDVIVIEPSTGFGTGHHQSTRLCLRALQTLDLRGLEVLDVGTGSGVLAIAAIRRGAARATAIDPDPDAIEAAADSVARNDAAAAVHLRTVGLDDPALTPASLVLANLTGLLLRRQAATLQRLIAAGGRAILSGFTEDEARWVALAFDQCVVEATFEEESWVCLVLRGPA